MLLAAMTSWQRLYVGRCPLHQQRRNRSKVSETDLPVGILCWMNPRYLLIQFPEDAHEHHQSHHETPGQPHSHLEVTSHRILKSSTTLQVPPELSMYIQHQPDMAHAQRFALIDRQILRTTHDVLDFSAVQIVLGKGGNVLFGERLDIQLAVRLDPLEE